ncbi:hypothetical protein GLYMA_11G176164v4 [Glycine max]|nr:hypothetical protein GLYMA_11G176164v4 [Glycine max]KAH1115789.1 hypothetical protein GYH30_057089 [Glycine max]
MIFYLQALLLMPSSIQCRSKQNWGRLKTAMQRGAIGLI